MHGNCKPTFHAKLCFFLVSTRAIDKVVKGVQPRKRGKKRFPKDMMLSGLEPMRIGLETNFVNIGERCNVAGSRVFCRLIKNGKYDVSSIF